MTKEELEKELEGINTGLQKTINSYESEDMSKILVSYMELSDQMKKIVRELFKKRNSTVSFKSFLKKAKK